MEDVGTFYEHLVYFTNIWSILRPFGLFYDHLVYFMVVWYIYCFPFWYVVLRKIWQPWSTNNNFRRSVISKKGTIEFL
jgi:hypothetical protein